MRTYAGIGMAVPQVLLPKPSIDPSKWAVVACDQYTSQPEYWAEAERLVGSAPSTLRLIYPEAYLAEAAPAKRIAAIQSEMRKYLAGDVFERHDGMVLVERRVAGHTRRGLVTCIDLERYDYHQGSTTLVRATEGTILERIPPRVRIRKDAPLELPHILILIDDPEDTVIGGLIARKQELRKLYDFELMQGGGHLCGYLVGEGGFERQVVTALEQLALPEVFTRRYGLAASTPVLLYAMGDGNHSLATAKAIWEERKQAGAALDHPARWALVELVNLHDQALVFEPIHRVLFDVRGDLVRALEAHYPGRVETKSVANAEEMRVVVTRPAEGVHRFGLITAEGHGVVTVRQPATNLSVGTLQQFLDPFLKGGGAREIDYVHGAETVETLGRKPGHAGFFLPGMDKFDLFKSVILDGVLPRKTFSMGAAEEKRFYMECRQLG